MIHEMEANKSAQKILHFAKSMEELGHQLETKTQGLAYRFEVKNLVGANKLCDLYLADSIEELNSNAVVPHHLQHPDLVTLCRSGLLSLCRVHVPYQ